MDELGIETIKIQNVGCIESLEIKPEIVTVVSGENGVGKSTVIKALLSLLESGNDPDLLKDDTEEGMVQVLLKTGESITETLTPGATDRIVRHPQMGKISQPKNWIKSIINAISFDPAEFLTAKPEKRIEIFLQALPKRLTKEQLSFLPDTMIALFDLDKHALKVIGDNKSGLYGVLYQKRSEINRVIKEKQGMSAGITQTLPEAAPPGTTWKAELARLNGELETLQAITKEQSDQIGNDANAATESQQELFRQTKAGIEAELQASIQRMREQAANVIQAEQDLRDKKIKEISLSADEAYNALATPYQEKRTALIESIGKVNEKAEQEIRAQSSKDLVQKVNSEIAANQREAEIYTGQMNDLVALKEKLISDLPIKDLEISEGRLLYKGKPFDRLNDSKKHAIAVEIMRLNRGPLGLMVLDRAEIFDEKNWELFQQACIEAKVPIFAARVTNQPGLHIETKGK